MASTYHFIPNQDGNAPAATPQTPAAPVMTHETRGGMDRVTISFGGSDTSRDAPAHADMGVPLDPANPHGPRIGHSNMAGAQTFNSADLAGATTSFLDDRDQPCAPNRATRVRLGDGQVTSLQAAVHLGVVSLTNDGPIPTPGVVFRNGEVYQGRQAEAVLQAEQAQNLVRAAAQEWEALDEQFGPGKWNLEHLSPQSRAVFAHLSGRSQAAPGAPGAPAMTPLTAEQMAARAAAARAAQGPQLPDVIDGRDPQLQAAERALSDGINPGTMAAFRSQIAVAVASGDPAAISQAVQLLSMESRISPERAEAIAQIAGRQIGRPVQAIATKLGVQPQQLMAALQRADIAGYTEAMGELARTHNAAPLVKLVTKLVTNARRGR